MNKFITDVLRSENFEELPVISLEDELSATLEAENIRHILSTELEDAARTVSICEALEGLAFVAQTVDTPTPQQAALISIGGDLAMAGTEMTGEEITPSLEDAGETGLSTASKVRSAIEQVIKVLRELLARVAAAVKKYVQHIRSAIGGHVQRQKLIEERLKEVRSKKQFSDKEFSFSFPMAEGKTISNLEELVRQAVRFTVVSESFLKQANEFNIGYASTLVQLYAQIGGEKSVVENFSKLNDVAKSSQRMGKSNSVEQTDLPNLDYFGMRRLESEQLIGGVTIVTTQAMSLQEPEEMSSASFKQALDELTTHIGVKIKTAEGGWSKESFMTKPLTLAQLDTAVKVCAELIEHYTGKSEHTSLAAATERRAEFAETSVEHITKYVDKFKKDDPSSKDFAMSAQRVGTSIITNASTPYTSMSSAMSRVISVLQSAIIKSLNAHEGTDKTKSSNESITEELVYSEEGFFGDVIGGIKKALGLRKPTALNLQKINSGYNDLKELKTKVQKNYIQTKHEVKTGEMAASNIAPYLFVPKGSQDPSQLPGEWNTALQSAHGAMTNLADMMAKSGMEGFAIFKKYSTLEKSVENFKKMEAEFEQFLRKWGKPGKPNLSGVLKNFQLDEMSLLGKNPDVASFDERKVWNMGELRPSIVAAAQNSKLPVLTSEQIPDVGKAMLQAIDFLMNHQVKDIIKDTSETLMNIEYGHEIVIYNLDWFEDQWKNKTLKENELVYAWLVESAGDQYRFLYYDMMLEYFVAIMDMILAADRWISMSIKD